MINIYYLTCSVELKFRTSLATWFWLGSHAVMRTAKNRYIEGLTEEQDSHEGSSLVCLLAGSFRSPLQSS